MAWLVVALCIVGTLLVMANVPGALDGDSIQDWFFLGLVILVTLAFFGLLADFFQPIFWAATLAVIFHPSSHLTGIARALSGGSHNRPPSVPVEFKVQFVAAKSLGRVDLGCFVAVGPRPAFRDPSIRMVFGK